jgi:hypothetical protein
MKAIRNIPLKREEISEDAWEAYEETPVLDERLRETDRSPNDFLYTELDDGSIILQFRLKGTYKETGSTALLNFMEISYKDREQFLKDGYGLSPKDWLIRHF